MDESQVVVVGAMLGIGRKQNFPQLVSVRSGFPQCAQDAGFSTGPERLMENPASCTVRKPAR
jgi:hypothetical protein